MASANGHVICDFGAVEEQGGSRGPDSATRTCDTPIIAKPIQMMAKTVRVAHARFQILEVPWFDDDDESETIHS